MLAPEYIAREMERKVGCSLRQALFAVHTARGGGTYVLDGEVELGSEQTWIVAFSLDGILVLDRDGTRIVLSTRWRGVTRV